MRYDVKNPDPAWPEMLAFFIFVLLCFTNGLSDQKLIPWLVENWWPILRIVLFFWIPARMLDWMQGGPSKRKVMRVQYEAMMKHVTEQSKRF